VYLEITPTYRFTRDGFELDLFHEDFLRGIKRMEGHRAVLSAVLLWADFLNRRNAFCAGHSAPHIRRACDVRDSGGD
jgi:hypothetical protein